MLALMAFLVFASSLYLRFDLFSPEEWIQGNNPGRKFLGEEVLKYLQSH